MRPLHLPYTDIYGHSGIIVHFGCYRRLLFSHRLFQSVSNYTNMKSLIFSSFNHKKRNSVHKITVNYYFVLCSSAYHKLYSYGVSKIVMNGEFSQFIFFFIFVQILQLVGNLIYEGNL